jgi:hypothetical protein
METLLGWLSAVNRNSVDAPTGDRSTPANYCMTKIVGKRNPKEHKSQWEHEGQSKAIDTELRRESSAASATWITRRRGA